MQKKEIIRFYAGNRFDNREVNNFLVNQQVHARINFYCLSKFNQLQFANCDLITAQLEFSQLQFAQL